LLRLPKHYAGPRWLASVYLCNPAAAAAAGLAAEFVRLWTCSSTLGCASIYPTESVVKFFDLHICRLPAEYGQILVLYGWQVKI